MIFCFHQSVCLCLSVRPSVSPFLCLSYSHTYSFSLFKMIKLPSCLILAIILLPLIIMDCYFPRFTRIICFLPSQDLLVRIGCSITIYSRVSVSFPIPHYSFSRSNFIHRPPSPYFLSWWSRYYNHIQRYCHFISLPLTP